jgi:anti-sigma B factor antagonist
MVAFGITTTLTDDGCTLAIRGEFDLAAAPDVIALGTVVLDEPERLVLTIDLGDVTFLDSTGIGALVQLQNSATACDKQLQLARIPDRVRKLLALTGLDVVFAEFTPADDTPGTLSA